MPRNSSYSGRDASRGTTGDGNVGARARRQRNGPPTGVSADGSDFIRLNKFIARAGVCSRRKADALIEQGRVIVNGDVVTELGSRVRESDDVRVNGRSISPTRHVYILLNKPRDTITTTDDPRDRDTVMDLIALEDEEKRGLFPVGRLDRETTGVLLVTNDGELAHRLMHPSYEIDKLYRVKTKEPVKPHELDQLRKGVLLEDGEVAVDKAAYVAPPDQRDIGLSIHEGRNRQIRRMLAALGHDVVDLERVNYAGLTVEGVRRGRWRRLSDHEVRRLRRQVSLN